MVRALDIIRGILVNIPTRISGRLSYVDLVVPTLEFVFRDGASFKFPPNPYITFRWPNYPS